MCVGFVGVCENVFCVTCVWGQCLCLGLCVFVKVCFLCMNVCIYVSVLVSVYVLGFSAWVCESGFVQMGIGGLCVCYFVCMHES